MKRAPARRVKPKPRRAATDGALIAPEQLLALFGARDLEALTDAAFEMLRAAVVCDFASAFYRSAGEGMLMKQRDSMGRDYGPEFMRRYAELTPARHLARESRGIKVLPTRTMWPLPTAELRRTAFYQEIMRPQGWRHSVAQCFWGNPTAEMPILVTSVYRREGRKDFSPRDIAILERMHPYIDCAVNRLHEQETASTVRDGIALAVRDGSRGFAVLDGNFLLLQASPAAHQLCAAWADDAAANVPGGGSSDWRLPAPILTACRELRREWQVILGTRPDATGGGHRLIAHSDKPELSARVSLVCSNTPNLVEPTFVLELDRLVHGLALDTPDQSAPALQRMTAAERAVALILADGLSNQEIADRLGKTVPAVKFLLHRIYQKTGIPSRAALVAVLRAQPRAGRVSDRALESEP